MGWGIYCGWLSLVVAEYVWGWRFSLRGELWARPCERGRFVFGGGLAGVCRCPRGRRVGDGGSGAWRAHTSVRSALRGRLVWQRVICAGLLLWFVVGAGGHRESESSHLSSSMLLLWRLWMRGLRLGSGLHYFVWRCGSRGCWCGFCGEHG